MPHQISHLHGQAPVNNGSASIVNGGFMSITPNQLKQIIADQQLEHRLPEPYIKRAFEEKLLQLKDNKEIIVLTGVRRCGKSVLLQQVREHSAEKDYYFNFEDDRLVEFTVADFQILYETFQELFGPQKTFYFDEIQNIIGWEKFVRRIYNSGNKIYITGSNTTLFSEELGTRLTGRYIAQTIYPLSYYEFVEYQDKTLLNKKSYSTQDTANLKKIFSIYCDLGGFPEFVHYKQVDYLHSLYESIIYRDIIVRYKLPNDKLIKQLVFYLASNCSKEFTYSSLKNALGFGSATTVSDYCSYLEKSYPVRLAFVLAKTKAEYWKI
jgi:predicted AAA+ superfamily ATPase